MRARIIIFVFAALVAGSTAALAEKRVALILGMSKYQNVPALTNPGRDAAAMGELFNSAGFDTVDTKLDLTLAQLRREVKLFAAAAADADIAVVYYAGHGIEVNGANYLIPADAKLASDYDIPDETFPLDRILDALEPVKRLRLVILDACRDNPFNKTMKRSLGTRSIGRGLAKVEPTTSNTLVAFAARAGAVASDGDGANSPFANALLKYITTPGLELRLAFGKVRDDVIKTTANQQEPFVYGSLGGDAIALVPAETAAVASSSPAPDDAAIRRDYELALQIGTREAWDYFIANYPNSFYSRLAKAQRNKLSGVVASLSPDQSTPKTDGPVAVGDIPRQLQIELRRVGCNTGAINDTWTPAAQKSMELFNRNAGMKLDVKVASLDSLDIVKSKAGRICPLSCERGYQVDGDRCTKITCKAGYEVGDSNTCEKIEVRKPAPPVARQERGPAPTRRAAESGGAPSAANPMDCNGPMGFANCVARNLSKDRWQ